MTSARRLPASYNTSTYGNATRDYTSLSTWEAATDNDLVTATNGEVLECYDDAASFDDAVDFVGATTNADYYRVIKPATAQGHDGTINNGFTLTPTVGTLIVDATTIYCCIDIQESYSTVFDIIIDISIDSVYTYPACILLKASNATAVGCIMRCINAGSGGGYGLIGYCATTVLLFSINNIVLETKTQGFRKGPNETVVLYCYNCTAVDTSTGFFSVSGTDIAKNCISCDNTTDFSGTWTKTTCYEGDATIFKDQVADDYHLDSTDTTCRGNGTDLSSDGVYAFDDDIDGTIRSAWDIGFDEYSVLGWTGKVCGITNPAKIMGISAANITKVNGV